MQKTDVHIVHFNQPRKKQCLFAYGSKILAKIMAKNRATHRAQAESTRAPDITLSFQADETSGEGDPKIQLGKAEPKGYPPGIKRDWKILRL